ncbi:MULTISPECIES: hypothetical protein [unclassified Rhizobium]|uniref:hypothetical protein n=1 Tax=unclassified Rhizobium TaxID=2613769 RepID=UPI000CDF3AFC|nr:MULTISPECIES: hypothetical protein [Rhizobium]AVA23377.1 hypothetical protein NXC24_CH03765 [Rhizobium sp. NXC24]MDK4739633.1 hypothetical protein [Rhizobium sp. CNPSo 3464]UWU20724.1 hypothetical protein N2601_15815 [Rhizobium tropici]
MISWAKPLLIFEVTLFAAASLVHSGILLDGYAHARAATAEGLIAAVLACGIFACLFQPAWTRSVALAVQSFALFATLVGAFTIAIGIGPQTTADRVFHLLLLLVLISGFVAAFRWNSP